MQNNKLIAKFHVIGVSYKKTDTTTRGRYSLSADQQAELCERLNRSGGRNVLVISTCNRTEVYCEQLERGQLIEALAWASGGPVELLRAEAFQKSGAEAVRHLFAVGCGLDSQIVGDFEIIGQVKKSFELSKKLQVVEALLDRIVSLVIKSSKRIKTETQLSTGATSVSFSGVQYIRTHVEGLAQKKILLYGIGQMGLNTCENLVKHSKHESITLINRNAEKAETLSKKYQVVSKPLEDLQEELDASDILFVATGARVHTIGCDMLEREKPILILDLSLPRNVDPAAENLPHVKVVHLDKLSALSEAMLEERAEHLPHAKLILEEELRTFEEWLDSRSYVPVLSALNSQLKGFKDNELDKLFRDVDAAHHDDLRLVTDKLVHKITGKLALHLRSKSTAVASEIESIQRIFQLDSENNPR